MKPGMLQVRRTGRGEMVFEVHLWPRTTELPRTCSSVCAEREPVESISPRWARDQDRDKIGLRLGPSESGRATGREKGRVLYLIERTPLTNSFRVAAVALLSLRKGRVLQLYRLCFNDDVILHERDLHSVELVQCARALAREAEAKLHMLVPQGRKAGEMRIAYNFTGTTKDQFGQEWVI